MARMPGVQFLGIADNGTMKAKDIVCIHTIVGYQEGGNAAHFTTGAEGKIVQARDTNNCSAANLNGNYHVIAIENEDMGPAYGNWNTNDGHAVPGFTADQKEAIAKIIAWCHQVHDIPISLIPDSKPGRRGVAYHRQGITGDYSAYDFPGRISGGEVWSSHEGKVCPGDRRIRQLINEIIPRARALAGLQEEDVTAAEVWSYDNPNFPQGDAFWFLRQAAVNPWTYKNTGVYPKDAYGMLKDTLDAASVNPWRYKNLDVYPKDAYGMLHDTKVDTEDLKSKVAAIDEKLDTIYNLLQGGTS